MLQTKEHRRKHLLKPHVRNETKESTTHKRKHIPCHDSPEKRSKHTVLKKDAEQVEASLRPGDSRAFGNHLCDVRHLGDLEKSQLMEMLQQAASPVVTLMFKDGSTQLRADQVSKHCGFVYFVFLAPKEKPMLLVSEQSEASDFKPSLLPSGKLLIMHSVS